MALCTFIDRYQGNHIARGGIIYDFKDSTLVFAGIVAVQKRSNYDMVGSVDFSWFLMSSCFVLVN